MFPFALPRLVFGLELSFANISILLGTSIIILLLSTWLITFLRSGIPSPGRGKAPPLAPYWLPYLGHTMIFLRDPDGLFRSLDKRYPNIPYTLTLLGTKFHVISDPSSVSTIFNKTRDFLVDPITPSLLESAFGLPATDKHKFHITLDAAKKLARDMTQEELESQAFNAENHSVFVKYLNGRHLDWMAKTYIATLPKQLDRIFPPLSSEWKTVSFYHMMQELMFSASVVAFFGTRFASAYPELSEDFWKFNDGANVGARHKLMWITQPSKRKARDRMLRHFKSWVDTDLEEWKEDDVEWNEKWGAKLNWERERLFRNRGFTTEGRACMQVAFLWGLNANAIAVTTWFLLLTIQQPELLKAFRREVQSAIVPQDPLDKRTISFDITRLASIPLLQGIYKESLRLGSATATARVVSNDTAIGGYILSKGSVVLMPVRTLHFAPEVFSEPETFDPYRWILKDVDSKDEAMRIKKQGASLRTFGGGVGLCPGRYVAEQEILSSTAMMIMLFDIELEAGQGKPMPDPRNLMGMSPIEDPRVRLRRRVDPRAL